MQHDNVLSNTLDMIHMVCDSVESDAKKDLEKAVRLLFNIQNDNGKGRIFNWFHITL